MTMKIVMTGADQDLDPAQLRLVRQEALEAAARIRQLTGQDVRVEILLTEEVTSAEVDSVPAMGEPFVSDDRVVALPRPESGLLPRARSRLARQHEERKLHGTTSTHEDSEREIVLRPSWRMFYKHYGVMLAGLIVAIVPHKLLMTAGVSAATVNAMASTGVLGLVTMVGAFVAAGAVGSVLVFYYGHSYHIGHDQIESRVGIIARRLQRLEYLKISGVEIDQGVIDRLLDIGRVEIATANTGGVEVQFDGVYNPMAVQEEVARRKRALESGHLSIRRRYAD
jgi:membrane protein YdbS with pleckstrin-like domain